MKHEWISDSRCGEPLVKWDGYERAECCAACGVSRAYMRLYFKGAPDDGCTGRGSNGCVLVMLALLIALAFVVAIVRVIK